MGRILALDFGTIRIGVAVSDETKTISQPKPYILNKEKHRIIDFINDNNVEEIVLGRPIAMSGKETKSTELATDFYKWISSNTGLKIYFIDERMTTQEIKRVEKNKNLIDSLVAQKMLERFLSSKNR